LNLRPLGYETYDARLRCLRWSLDGALTSADVPCAFVLVLLRLPRFKPSRRVSCTNQCTNQALDLQVPATFARCLAAGHFVAFAGSFIPRACRRAGRASLYQRPIAASSAPGIYRSQLLARRPTAGATGGRRGRGPRPWWHRRPTRWSSACERTVQTANAARCGIALAAASTTASAFGRSSRTASSSM
jgi:hypothetical protein